MNKFVLSCIQCFCGFIYIRRWFRFRLKLKIWSKNVMIDLSSFRRWIRHCLTSTAKSISGSWSDRSDFCQPVTNVLTHRDHGWSTGSFRLRICSTLNSHQKFFLTLLNSYRVADMSTVVSVVDQVNFHILHQHMLQF